MIDYELSMAMTARLHTIPQQRLEDIQKKGVPTVDNFLDNNPSVHHFLVGSMNRLITNIHTLGYSPEALAVLGDAGIIKESLLVYYGVMILTNPYVREAMASRGATIDDIELHNFTMGSGIEGANLQDKYPDLTDPQYERAYNVLVPALSMGLIKESSPSETIDKTVKVFGVKAAHNRSLVNRLARIKDVNMIGVVGDPAIQKNTGRLRTAVWRYRQDPTSANKGIITRILNELNISFGQPLDAYNIDRHPLQATTTVIAYRTRKINQELVAWQQDPNNPTGNRDITVKWLQEHPEERAFLFGQFMNQLYNGEIDEYVAFKRVAVGRVVHMAGQKIDYPTDFSETQADLNEFLYPDDPDPEETELAMRK